MSNGWQSGKDPAQRVLRIVSGVVALVAFAVLTLDPSRGDDLGVLATAAGVLLVLLGFGTLSRLPIIGGGSVVQPPEEEDKDGAG